MLVEKERGKTEETGRVEKKDRHRRERAGDEEGNWEWKVANFWACVRTMPMQYPSGNWVSELKADRVCVGSLKCGNGGLQRWPSR